MVSSFADGVAKLCGIGKGGERVCGTALAEEGGAEQEAGLGIVRRLDDERAEAAFGSRKLALVQKRTHLLQGVEGERGNDLGGGTGKRGETQRQDAAVERLPGSQGVQGPWRLREARGGDCRRHGSSPDGGPLIAGRCFRVPRPGDCEWRAGLM